MEGRKGLLATKFHRPSSSPSFPSPSLASRLASGELIEATRLCWIHVLVGLFAPSLALILLYAAGPFYLIWFPMLGRDLLKLGPSASEE